MQRLLMLTAGLTALLAPCSEHSDPSGVSGTTVAVEDNRFTPQQLPIAPGSTVTWQWRGASLHNVTFDDGPTSTTQEDGQFQRQFSAAGTYPYHCTIHGLAMSGSVVVQ